MKQLFTIITPIVGLALKGGKKMISIESNVGIPRDSVLGPYVCNLVLDGIDGLLLKLACECKAMSKHFLKYETNNFLYKMPVSAGVSQNYYYPKTNITYLRYADNILFYGFHKKIFFLIIKKQIYKFLSERCFLIKSSTNVIFQFKPGSMFSFLGYRYIFLSKFKKQTLSRRKFTKKKYVFLNTINPRFSTNQRYRILLAIAPDSYQMFKSRIRQIFKKGRFHLSIEQLIFILNKKIKAFASYFPYSENIKAQLILLDNLIRK